MISLVERYTSSQDPAQTSLGLTAGHMSEIPSQFLEEGWGWAPHLPWKWFRSLGRLRTQPATHRQAWQLVWQGMYKLFGLLLPIGSWADPVVIFPKMKSLQTNMEIKVTYIRENQESPLVLLLSGLVCIQEHHSFWQQAKKQICPLWLQEYCCWCRCLTAQIL